MKSVMKILTLILIQAVLSANCVRAADFREDFLSPQIVISNGMLKNIFNLPGIAYLTRDSFFIDETAGLSASGIAQVEFGMVFHQLANKVSGVITVLEYLQDVKTIDTADYNTASIVRVSEKLRKVFYDIQGSFELGQLTQEESIKRIIEQIKDLRLEMPELKRIKNSGSLKDNLKPVLNAQLDCIDFLNQRAQSLIHGVKIKSFSLSDLLEKDRNFKSAKVNETISPQLYGYRDGLDFVIRNIRSNIFVHADPEMIRYTVNTRETDDEIIIEVIDFAGGINISMLREKAVELAFLSRQEAADADEAALISLIFRKGFSRRYKQGQAHGLGLWLSKEIIERYFGGGIRAENRKDVKGAKFTINIPKRRVNISLTARQLRLKIKRIGIIDEIQRTDRYSKKTALSRKGIAPSTFYRWKKKYKFNDLSRAEIGLYRARYQQILIEESNAGFARRDNRVNAAADQMKFIEQAI